MSRCQQIMIFIFMGVLRTQKPPKSGFAPKPQANTSVSFRKLEGRIWQVCGGWWDGRGLLCQFEPPEFHNLPVQIALCTHLPLHWETIYHVVEKTVGYNVLRLWILLHTFCQKSSDIIVYKFWEFLKCWNNDVYKAELNSQK